MMATVPHVTSSLGLRKFKADGFLLTRVNQGSWVTKFCEVVPNICGSSLWNMLNVTLLAPKTFRWLLDFWKLCAPPG